MHSTILWQKVSLFLFQLSSFLKCISFPSPLYFFYLLLVLKFYLLVFLEIWDIYIYILTDLKNKPTFLNTKSKTTTLSCLPLCTVRNLCRVRNLTKIFFLFKILYHLFIKNFWPTVTNLHYLKIIKYDFYIYVKF